MIMTVVGAQVCMLLTMVVMYHVVFDFAGESRRFEEAKVAAREMDVARLAALPDGGVWKGPGAGWLAAEPGVLASLDPPDVSFDKLHMEVRALQAQVPYEGSFASLPRPIDKGGEEIFRERRERCHSAAWAQRTTTNTPRLAIPLTELGRFVAVEPADCAGCAKPRCSNCNTTAPSPTTIPCCLELLGAVLGAAATWLQANQVKHFLIGGTLLGAVQQGRATMWQEGATIAIEASALSKLRELDEGLMERGVAYYVNQERRRPWGWGPPRGELCLHRETLAAQSRTGPHRDSLVVHNLSEVGDRDHTPWWGDDERARQHPHIVLIPFTEGQGFVHMPAAPACQRHLHHNAVFPLSTVQMHGLSWPVPRFAHEALAQMFGAHYLDPDFIGVAQSNAAQYGHSNHRENHRLHLEFCNENGL